MTILFDKNQDSGITTIDCGGMDADVFKWDVEGASSHIMNTTNFKIKIGAIDTTVTFDSLAAMEPYIQSFDSYNLLQDPFNNGVNTDPFYDKIPSGEIQSHTYVDTDIEKDLINGAN